MMILFTHQIIYSENKFPPFFSIGFLAFTHFLVWIWCGKCGDLCAKAIPFNVELWKKKKSYKIPFICTKNLYRKITILLVWVMRHKFKFTLSHCHTHNSKGRRTRNIWRGWINYQPLEQLNNSTLTKFYNQQKKRSHQ